MKQIKVPKGKQIKYEDDICRVYSDKGEVVYEGMFDDCPYKYDANKWNENEQCYDLLNGYKMIGL